MDHISEKKFPVNAKDYKLYEEVGEGVSASVYRALCIPLNEIVAIKVLDLERCNNDLISPTSARERELQAQLINLQQSVGSLVEDLQRLKAKNAQLEKQLNALASR